MGKRKRSTGGIVGAPSAFHQDFERLFGVFGFRRFQEERQSGKLSEEAASSHGFLRKCFQRKNCAHCTPNCRSGQDDQGPDHFEFSGGAWRGSWRRAEWAKEWSVW